MKKPLSHLVFFWIMWQCILASVCQTSYHISDQPFHRYNYGLSLYRSFACADLNNTINSFGQNSESGRDQAHVQLSLGNMAELCQTAFNQGNNYWDLLKSRLGVGYEYTASYNLGNTVKYDPDFFRWVSRKSLNSTFQSLFPYILLKYRLQVWCWPRWWALV